MNHTLQRLFFMVLTAGPLTAFTAPLQAEAETIEDCLAMAEENYPLVRRYDLVTKTEQFTLSNIVRGWLPQVSAYGQATYQSAVVQLPAQLEQIMAAQGTEIVGINPLQYRAGVDVQQTVYDGGATAAAKEMARAQTALEGARNDVDIYSLRERVNGVFFGWLLMEERLRLNAELQTLLSANVTKLEALLTGGVAMGSDVDAVRAELATVRRAAEAKLTAGIIDTNALLQEITRENQAAIQRSIHRIEYLKALYEVERIGQ